jgi:hypothetical protein
MAHVFWGREGTALELAIARLAKLEQCKESQIIDELYTEMGATLTEEDIKLKNYTYCMYTVSRKRTPGLATGQVDPNYVKPTTYTFLVPSTNKKRARAQALFYLQNLGLSNVLSTQIDLYPRNYIAKAREHFERGAYYGAPEKRDI